MAMMTAANRRGGPDPYASDYRSEMEGLDIKAEEEIMGNGEAQMGQKSFSF